MAETRARAGEGYAGQFQDADQRRRADAFGMWVFLGTELMLFGGVFAALMVYRITFPVEAKAVARHLQIWIAAANTAILLTSSFAMAAATVLIRYGRRRATRATLAATAGLGALFLALKAYEYVLDFRDGIIPARLSPLFHDRPTTLFVDLYYVATGLHAVHLTIAVGWIATLAIAVTRTHRPMQSHLHVAGLYWHLVDVIWIFLYPVLYLGRSGA
jgi:cytochrome c oxidase subunit 3